MAVHLALQPTTRTPEKILVVGSGGSGKSYNALQIAKRCLMPNQTMYVVDTEQAFPVLLEEAGMGVREEWVGNERDETWEEEGSPIVRYWARDWPEQRYAITEAIRRARPGDWVVVDSITHPWADVQSWYMGIVNDGMEMGDWLVQTIANARESGRKDEGAGEMLREWRPINAQWSQYVRKPIMRAGCHLYITAHTKTINTDKDSAEVKTMWGSFGLKADTQKSMGHDVRTVLGMERSRGAGGGWKVTTVKDWGREDRELVRADLTDIPSAYLKDVAGWKMTKENV